MKYRLLLISAIAWSCAIGASAQPTPDSSSQDGAREGVRATIDSLFDGMRAGDSTTVRAVFAPGAELHTALGPSDTAAVRTTSVDAFVRAVGQPHEKVWDERVWNVEIQIDGPLASAWVPYAFYHGDDLSHCGVNAIQLIRQEKGWRILQLTDTRRSECDIPDEVANSHRSSRD